MSVTVMGVWLMQSRRAPHAEGPHSWFMFCCFYLKMLSTFWARFPHAHFALGSEHSTTSPEDRCYLVSFILSDSFPSTGLHHSQHTIPHGAILLTGTLNYSYGWLDQKRTPDSRWANHSLSYRIKTYCDIIPSFLWSYWWQNPFIFGIFLTFKKVRLCIHNMSFIHTC